MWRSFRKHFRPTLALKLSLLVLASTGVIFMLAFGYSNRIARKSVLKEVEANTRNLARATVNRIEALLHAVEPLPQLLARYVARERPGEEEVMRLIQDELLASPHIYGSGVVFAPGQSPNPGRLTAPYFYRKSGAFHYADLAQASYDYLSQDWYLLPRELGKAVWTDPYFDAGGGETMMCTYCVPFYRQAAGQSVFAGMVGADLELEHLVRIVSSIKLYQRGYAFLLSQNGQFLSHPNSNYVFNESIFSLADETGDKQWRDIGRRMLHGDEGFVRVYSPNTRLNSWLYYAPISSGWSVGILFPEDDILTDLRAMNRVVFWIGYLGFGLLLAVIILLSTSITRPIRALAHQTHEIARGNLDLAVPPLTSHDEVGDLSQSFENMRLALKEYVANLAAATAAKERIESELKIARTIQRSFLPKRFPPFPERREFEVYAALQAAREVGGDLYDFFLLNHDHLFFSIGDVSGKGVPAALFMAVTKTLVKGVAEQHLSPSQILAKVNHELFVDNEEMMFVTVFCGALDLRTGELQYTNAGHLPPVLLRASGQVAWLPLPKGTMLGISEAPVFATTRVRLEPRDTLLLYTDGVNEAMASGGQLFGEDRLLAFTQARVGMAPKELVEGVLGAVHQFAAGEEQSDDITVLGLRYFGTEGPSL